MMKKLFAIVAALVLATFAHTAEAQLPQIEEMPPYKLGVTVGLNMPWYSGSIALPFDLSDYRTHSNNYGVTAGMQIGANLMLDGSFLIRNTFARVETKYSMKGASGKITYNGRSSEEEITTHYIEIPVHFGYAWFINDDISVMAETGPYVAFGFSGVCKGIENGKALPNAGVFDARGGNRFDFGWGIQGSVMVAKNYQLSLAYDMGFVNINKSFLQNRNLSLGLTWFFESLLDF